MRAQSLVVAVSLTLLALLPGCALPTSGADGSAATSDEPSEPNPEGVGSTSEELSSLNCSMSKATGYVSGKATSIEVVTVDSKKVEWKTANAYMRMAKAASAAGVEIRIVSGFRTMAEQQYLYSCYVNCSCNSCNLAAKPGYSNHQSGHALDLNTSASGVYSWLSKHAGSYGFKRTVPSEIWHWEWWGTDPGTGPCNDLDKDNDGIVDAKDNCPSNKNADQKDTDKDGKGDVCDTDDDGDGVADTSDNCPAAKNADQKDTDQDGKGDACDDDADGDGVLDDADNCPLNANANQADLDDDGLGDVCDDDVDGDGVPNSSDVCPGVDDTDVDLCNPTTETEAPPESKSPAPTTGSSPNATAVDGSTGCSVSAGAGASQAWLVALGLGLAWAARRRRR